MNRTAIAVLVVASVALALTPTVGGVAGNPVITLSAADNTVSPGQVTTLGVTVLNAGHVENGSARNPADERRVTTARGLTLSMRPGEAPIDVRTDRVAVGSVPEGAIGPVPFRIDVEEDARPGTYRVPVTLEYVYTSSITRENGTEVHEQSTVRRTTTVTLTVDERARFAVVNASTDAPVGGDGRLSVTIENVGEAPAREASVTLQSSNAALSFGGAPSARAFVGRWSPGETHTVAVEAGFAPTAESRSYAVDATVTYDRDDRTVRSDPLTVGVVPADEQSFALEDVNATLRVGAEGRLSGTLHNRGPSTVENAVLVLEPSGSVTAAETEYALGDLGRGERVPFAFDLEVSSSAREGPRQFTVRVRYEDDRGTTASDPLFARATVGPPRDTFAVEPVETNVTAGTTDRFVVEVTNTAGTVLTDISTKLFADEPVSARDDEAFVDRLEPGESTRLVFEVSAGGGALPKTYPVSLDFQYTEPDGDTKLSDTHRVPVRVADDGGGLLPFALGWPGLGWPQLGSLTAGGVGLVLVRRLL